MKLNNSKFRNIQASNLLLEQRLISEKQNLSEGTATLNSASEIKKFQDWMDTIGPWVKSPSGKYVTLNKGKGYGILGPSTRAAWNFYKKRYLSKKDNVESKGKGYPYEQLRMNPTPKLIASVIKDSKGGLLQNDKEAWAEAAFSKIKNQNVYKQVANFLGNDPYSYISEFMNVDKVYHTGPSIKEKMAKIKPEFFEVQKIVPQNFQKEYMDSLNKISPTKRTDGVIEPGQIQCAKFVTDLTGVFTSNAWSDYDYGKGTAKWSVYDNISEETKNKIKALLEKIGKQGGVKGDPQVGTTNNDEARRIALSIAKNSPNSKPSLGDKVGLFNLGSGYHETALWNMAELEGLRDGNEINDFSASDIRPFNTHVGVVAAVKNGVPIIYHNVHGTVHMDPWNKIYKDNIIVWTKSGGAQIA